MKRKLFFAIISILGMLAISGCNNPKTYIVTFDANGGVGTMAPQTFTEGEAQALTRNSFTNGDYTFVGWNTFDSGIGINYSDEQIITAVEDMTLYAQWDLLVPEKGELNGHEWVDLGLPSGTKWATCNVGASNPEEYGDYYAWGEIYTKDAYVRNTYKYLDTSVNGGRITNIAVLTV